VSTTTTRDEQLALGLDRLAEEVLAGLAPLSFDLARSPQDVHAALRMRYECVTEMGWARPEDFPDGRERDAHDERASHILCRDRAAVVGTLRLVPPRDGRPLPLEQEFGVRVEPPGEAVEAGRLVIAAEHRGGQGHPVLAGLFCRCWLEARELGYQRLVAAVPSKLIDLYRSLGLRVTALGAPRAHWGEERTPIEIAGREEAFAFVRGRLDSVSS
jgi:N-acyl-L-homoserine lactone synthetase